MEIEQYYFLPDDTRLEEIPYFKKILEEIKVLNNQAYEYGKELNFGKGWVQKLRKTEIWKKGKHANLKWDLSLNPTLVCTLCFKEIHGDKCVMHHKKYIWKELFNPDTIQFLHPNCHRVKYMHDFISDK